MKQFEFAILTDTRNGLALAVVELQDRGRPLHRWIVALSPHHFMGQWWRAMSVVNQMFMSTTRGLNPAP